MSQVQTLSDLRELVEQQDAVEPVAEVEQESTPVEAESEPQETTTESETVESAATDEEKPEWAKTEGQAVPVAKYVDLKHKLKATKAEADSEIERLRLEVEALKRSPAQTQSVAAPKPPTLEECGYDETVFVQKNAEYVEALIESKLSSHSQKSQSQHQAQAAEQSLNQEVDKHYERASEFVRKGVVSEENFRNADAVVRRAIGNLYPQEGDKVTDTLIANIGEGSEKVLYHLGANPQALSALEQSLRSDPSGLKAALYLGGLKTKFESAPLNKLSNAPKPDQSLKGDVAVGGKNYKSAFDKAVSVGDMYRIKREAKAAGIDTSKW
jgi:hypothetical protein